MLAAITYESMIKSMTESPLQQNMIGILLARPTSKSGKDIIETLPYYHHRSGENIHFYLPGYGAYWCGTYPDEQNVIVIDGVPWSFSNQKYVEFIEALEKRSTWQYSGESELLLVECANNALDYSNVLRFHLDAMLRDNAISSINVLFESIFRYASQQNELLRIGHMTGRKTLEQITMDYILEQLPKFFNGVIKKGLHYLFHNYSRC